MRLTEFSVKNSQFTFIIFLAVMALGFGSLMTMPRAEDPKFAPAGFSIIVVYPGASPAEIEEQIADPLEARLGALENIDRMRSQSLDGLLVLTIEFLHGNDPDKKYEEVLREFNAARPELPENIYRVQIQRFASSDVSILQAAIVSEHASWAEMRTQAELLEEQLERIAGIKGADTWGFPKREVRIDLNLPKMTAEGIVVSRVLGALQSENVSIPGGAVEMGERQFFVETSGDYADIEEVRNTIVNSTPGNIVYLKDIANVEYAYEDPSHLTRINGVRCVFVTCKMKDEQNIFEVAEQVNAAVANFKTKLPANMDYIKVFDQNDSVYKRLVRFAKDFGLAILLVLLTLLPLGWRAALVVMISIPLSIAMGVMALDLLGYSLNQLSIVGFIIALGILVDDSIVVVENIERWLRDGHSRRDAAIKATEQIGLAVIGCTATLVIAFLPLVFLPDDSGDFIRSLPMAVVVTVIASLLVSLTIVPFLSSRLLSAHHDPRGNVILRALKWVIARSYARLLHLALDWPKTTMLVSALIFLGVLSLAGRAGFALFPASERPMFYLDVEMASGSNFNATKNTMLRVDSVLDRYMVPGLQVQQLGIRNGASDAEPNLPALKYPGHGAQARITKYASNVGRGNPRVYYNVVSNAESAEYGQVFVQLQENTPPNAKLALIDTLREQFAHMPGAKINVKNFEQGPPVEAPIFIRIYGENLDTLRRLASEVETIIAGIEGTTYVDNPIAKVKTNLSIRINKEKAVTMGIPIVEIDRMVRLAVAGLNVGQFTADADGLEYNLNVSLPRTTERATLDVFKDLYINSLAGFSVPLNQVADIEFKPSPNFISHFNKDRFTGVSAYVKSGYFAAPINAELQRQLASKPLPTGYRIQVAGEVESASRSFGGMGTIILITVFGLLAVLILEFKTFKSTIIVLSVIPLGVIGAILILLATGYPFSFTVVVGLIALMGIEVKNSILLVDFTNQLRAEGRGLDEAIQEAGEIRFVPILLTSLTAIGGLIPIAIEGNPLYSPLSWVLIGGLISSTLLSRVVTPVLYKLLAPRVL
jgi:multidrug efflux pump subunit AcrB